MSYASPIDISSFTEFNKKEHSLVSECVFALDIGGSLAKLAYQTIFRYKICIPKELSDPNSKRKLSVCGPFEFYDYREHECDGQKLCFVKFETRFIEVCLDFIRDTILPLHKSMNVEENVQLVGRVTGGGAFAFMEKIKSKLPNVSIEREDEMDSLVTGCSFLLRNIPDEVFAYDKCAKPAHIFLSSCLVNSYPFLLVNIGSGVSFLKVDSGSTFHRVGGTSLGGGTFWGVGGLLSGDQPSFDQLLNLADEGDHRNVDMLVRDIYGGAYESLGLSGDVIASSFGLAARKPQETRKPADMVKALLVAISNNIGQLACMYAQLNNLQRILFGGFFIRGHALTMEVITFAVNYWSKGQMKAMFLRHEGYLGAVGAFMKSRKRSQDCSPLGGSTGNYPVKCWAENYVAGSAAFSDGESGTGGGGSSSGLGLSGCPSVGGIPWRPSDFLRSLSGAASTSPLVENSNDSLCPPVVPNQSDKLSKTESMLNSTSPSREFEIECSAFELEHLVGVSLESFPLLLSPSDYLPDTWDLTQDIEARVYWLDCFKQGVERLRHKAEESQADMKPDAPDRAKQFVDRYLDFLNELIDYPSGRGILTVRCILEAQQHFLREFGFPDAFCTQKKVENTWSLSFFPGIMERLQNLEWAERQLALVSGLLTGNIFDWGASEAVRFFTQVSVGSEMDMIDFVGALSKIPPRPWLVDDFDRWIQQISDPTKRPKCVLIFCDNSGADLILGVLPFVVECLNWGSKVILTANSGAAINDVTYPELSFLLNQVAAFDSRLMEALESHRLLCVDNGQSSPCLDLRRTSHQLVQIIKQEQVDLIIIEGMGRAIHTNFHARFRVDCLKVAVIKNSWLACRLGGDLFSVVFKYEQYSNNRSLP